MTTHDDLETRLRASLRERADDVETTPALYERVQRQAARGTWLRRAVAVAGAAAVLVAVIGIVPALLPDGPLEPDIADTPEDVAPSEAPSEEPTPESTEEPTDEPSAETDVEPAVPTDELPTSLEDELAAAGVAHARDAASGGSLVTVAGRTVVSPTRVVSLAASRFWTPTEGTVAAGRADGSIGLIAQAGDGGDAFDVVVDAAANGGGVAFVPDGPGIAWIEGTDLHVLPLPDQPEGERVLPLEGDVPPDLRIEQWFSASDAQIILATEPSGTVWRIPMDDSDSFNSAPTTPASVLPSAAGANDALLLADLQLVAVQPDVDGSGPTMTIGGQEVAIPGVPPDIDRVQLAGPAEQIITIVDPTTGWGVVQSIAVGGSTGEVLLTWQDPSIVAAVPTLPQPPPPAG